MMTVCNVQIRAHLLGELLGVELDEDGALEVAGPQVAPHPHRADGALLLEERLQGETSFGDGSTPSEARMSRVRYVACSISPPRHRALPACHVQIHAVCTCESDNHQRAGLATPLAATTQGAACEKCSHSKWSAVGLVKKRSARVP